ncbi:MAG: hypothetical protein ACYS47_09785 [Planctomycetota bacterium]
MGTRNRKWRGGRSFSEHAAAPPELPRHLPSPIPYSPSPVPRFPFLILLALFALPCRAGADVVELNDGTFLEGKVVKETRSYVTFLTKERKRKVLSRKKIRRLLKGVTLYNLYVQRRATLEAGKAEDHFALGLWCERVGMKGLATREFHHAVRLDPQLAGAREKLGHVKWEGTWYATETDLKKAQGLVPFRGRWLTPEEREKAAEDHREHDGEWFTEDEYAKLESGKPVALPGEGTWRIYRTLHYRLFTRLKKAKSLKFADMAEQAFAAYEAHFGFAPKGVMEGYVFGELQDFENYLVGLGMAVPGKLVSHGFFDSGTRRIYFPYIDDDYTTVVILIHELCHQFEVLSGRWGAVPVWFFEGIACAFGHHTWNGKALVPKQLVVKKNFNLYYFQQIVRTKEQWPLKAILTGSPGAKVDPTFYQHAWGLVWFLMHCEKGGYARKFKAYQEAIHDKESRGKNPVALFVHHFGPLDAVEKDFYAYILRIRGLPWRGKGRAAGSKK